MQMLFSQKNMLSCDIQDNKYGRLVKTIKKKKKLPIRPAGRVITFHKHQTYCAGCPCLNEH